MNPTVAAPWTTSATVPVLLKAEDARSQPGGLAFSTARFVLGVTLLAAPLAFGAVKAWSWASLAILALLLLLLWATGCIQQGVVRIHWSPLYGPAALFLLLGVVQFFGHLTLDPLATRESLLKLITDLIFFFIASQLWATSSDRTWRRLGLTVIIFASSLALFAILQFFSAQGLIYWAVKPRWDGWVFGPYVNHNHYAGLMEMLIPVGVTYVFSQPGKRPVRVLLGFAVLVPLASLLLSGSRGGLISVIAETLILSVILWRRARRGTPWRAPTMLGALGITAALLLFFWMDPGEISKRMATLVNFAHSPEATFGERKVVTLDCLRILRDHPWIGTGLGSFETAYPRYQSFPSDLLWDHAHNDYAEALAETGLVGEAVILAALVIFFSRAFRNLGERLKHESGWIQLGAALGCCGLLVHGLVDFNLHIPANAAWFAACAGAALSNMISLRRSAGRECLQA